MPLTNRFLIAPTVAFSVLFVFASGTFAQSGTPPVPLPPASSADGGKPCVPDPMKRHEMTGRSESPLFAPTGDPDRDFANMMSAHHQEGVDMAKRQLANGKSTKLKSMARRIIRDQQREIVELDRWSSRHNVRVSRHDVP